MARLLLVDDDPTQVRLWQIFLQAAGHQIETAETLDQALDRLEATPDVLLMDLRLPKLEDGLKLIRKADQRASVKILVLSGWPGDLESLPEQKLVDRVLAKPIQGPTLLRAIHEMSA